MNSLLDNYLEAIHNELKSTLENSNFTTFPKIEGINVEFGIDINTFGKQITHTQMCKYLNEKGVIIVCGVSNEDKSIIGINANVNVFGRYIKTINSFYTEKNITDIVGNSLTKKELLFQVINITSEKKIVIITLIPTEGRTYKFRDLNAERIIIHQEKLRIHNEKQRIHKEEREKLTKGFLKSHPPLGTIPLRKLDEFGNPIYNKYEHSKFDEISEFPQLQYSEVANRLSDINIHSKNKLEMEKLPELTNSNLKMLPFLESHTLEYKVIITESVKHVILKVICAFLNSHGGRIILGVMDSGEIIGLNNNFEELDAFLRYIDMIYHSKVISYENDMPLKIGEVSAKIVNITNDGNKKIIIVTVIPKKDNGTTYKINNGNVYYRLSATTYLLPNYIGSKRAHFMMHEMLEMKMAIDDLNNWKKKIDVIFFCQSIFCLILTICLTICFIKYFVTK